jgi:predicted nucleic acid-binding protein
MGELHAPDILAVEVAGVIVRDANSDKTAAGLQREKLMHFTELMASSAIRLSRTEPFDIARSAEMAIELGHPLKDCLYLALATQLDCPLVTADVRFAAKAQVVWDKVEVLGG